MAAIHKHYSLEQWVEFARANPDALKVHGHDGTSSSVYNSDRHLLTRVFVFAFAFVRRVAEHRRQQRCD